MREVELGQTGEAVGVLGLGTRLMGTEIGFAESARILDRFVAGGGSMLDTANAYAWSFERGSRGGESETAIGRWLRRSGGRDRVFIATKGGGMVRDPEVVWPPGRSPDWDLVRSSFEGAGGRTLTAALNASLRRLQTDYVDLYYVHVDDPSTPLDETITALADLVRVGKARYVGWSNVGAARLAEIVDRASALERPAPVAVQEQYTYFQPTRTAAATDERLASPALLSYLRGHPEVTLVAYSPLLRGVYDDFSRRSGHRLMRSYSDVDAEAGLERLGSVASELGVSLGEVVLGWLLSRPSPRVIPLVGPRTVDQLSRSMRAATLTLTPEQVATLDGTGRPAADGGGPVR